MTDAAGSFGQRLARVRQRRDMTQTEVAALAGIMPSAIAHFEAGRRKPGYFNIARLAKALAVTADELLGLPSRGSSFAGEEKLTHAQRRQIQDLIDLLVKRRARRP